MLEIMIGLAGLAFSVLTYWFGVRRGRRERAEDRQVSEAQDREARIERVVQGYIALAHGHPPETSGAHGLIRAGVRDLSHDAEIREALRRIEDRTGHQPLGRDTAQLTRADLKAFFAALQMNLLNVPNYPDVLARFRS